MGVGVLGGGGGGGKGSLRLLPTTVENSPRLLPEENLAAGGVFRGSDGTGALCVRQPMAIWLG